MEGEILLWIQEHVRSAAITPAVEWITHLGDTAFIWILMAAVFFVFPRTRETGLRVIAALLGSLAVNNLILKNLVARVRPYEVIEGLELLIERQPDWSFPSGHSAASLAAATVIWLSHRRTGWPAVVLAGLIALSRLYVGVHYPTDVMFGALSGIIIASSSAACGTGWRGRRMREMYDELTENDIKKIQEEIDYRKLVVRKEAIEAVKEARAHGDLSENFEYHAAKKDKNQNESRIRYLERMIRTAKIISDQSKADEVGINNRVELYFEDDDETDTYKIVTTVRGNSLDNKISNESPLGRAVLGRKVGDRVYVKVNDRSGYYVVIRSIDKSSDDQGDEIRKY